MEILELTIRPTFDSLINEDSVEGNDVALLYEQGLNSEPVSIEAEKEFSIPDGFEAVIDSPENAVILDKDSPLPEYVEKLSAGTYTYKGNGVILKCHDEPLHEDGEDWRELPMDSNPAEPTKVESKFLQILADAFPGYEFKYEQEGFYCRLGSERVNIFDGIKELPETEEEQYWATLPGLQTKDDVLSVKYAEYKMMRGLVERVSGTFFKQQGIHLIINRIPTFAEFLEL